MEHRTAKITYCGHSTVLIETETGKRIIIDPFIDSNPALPSSLARIGHIDYICLTHGHWDHSENAAQIAKEHGAIVFAIFELGNLLIKDGVAESQVELMNKGGEVAARNGNGVSVAMTNAFHSSSYLASDGNVYYAGEGAGIVVRLESGRTIYDAGDTCAFSDMRLIKEIYQPEVALLPVGDRFTMGPKEAALAANMIGAKTVIPIHHGTFDSLSGTAEEFEANVPTGVTVRSLRPGESLEV